jgi:mannose-6-phosphate isomerase-like protein (cupin superfamily)
MGQDAHPKVNLADKFGQIAEHWSPKIAGELNGQQVKLVKLLGDFVWHSHELEDELFLVVRGRFRMDFRDRSEWIEEGELIIVPRGVEHKPFAEEEAWIMLFEPVSTVNTGSAGGELTRIQLDRI